ncbi:MAG: CHC2 zinc finger domain-containing protein [Eubacteriales bacterium]|nr:CHC2 zinc finger domain-containing protein [Eubacteriales bacterium]
MRLFETVKAAVTVRQAVGHYGLKIGRNNMVCCPFHNDHTPSMKLNEDYFYCFGCGAHGDVIDLAARLFDLSNYEAARKLAADFGLDPDKPPSAATLKKPKRPLVSAFRDEEVHCQRVLCDYLHLLEDWKVRYAPQSPDEAWDDRFVEACQMLDHVEYQADILTFGELEDRVRLVEGLKKNRIIDDLEKRLKRLEKEESHEEEKSIAC